MFNFRLPIVNMDNEQVKIGDVYELTFAVKNDLLLGIIDITGSREKFLAWLIELSEKDGKKFEVERSYYNADNDLVVQAKVLKNPLPFLAVFGIIVGGSTVLLAMFGMTLNKVEKVITLPTGQIIVYTISGLSALFAYKSLKKG